VGCAEVVKCNVSMSLIMDSYGHFRVRRAGTGKTPADGSLQNGVFCNTKGRLATYSFHYTCTNRADNNTYAQRGQSLLGCGTPSYLSIQFFYLMDRKYVSKALKRSLPQMEVIIGLPPCAEIYSSFLCDCALGYGVFVIF
jgi:hypothetical protein